MGKWVKKPYRSSKGYRWEYVKKEEEKREPDKSTRQIRELKLNDVIQKYYEPYNNYLNNEGGKEIKDFGNDKISLFQRILSLEHIDNINNDDIFDLMEDSWAVPRWSDFPYKAYEILEKNDLSDLKNNFKHLLYSVDIISTRIDDFIKNTAGFGIFYTSEILSFIFPEEYCIWNREVADTFILLDLHSILYTDVWKRPMKVDGKKYVNCNLLMINIITLLNINGIKKANSVDVHLFLDYIYNQTTKKNINDVVHISKNQ